MDRASIATAAGTYGKTTPDEGTYSRHFGFTPQGWARTANNPIPTAALEGGVPELICIDPGGKKPVLAVSER